MACAGGIFKMITQPRSYFTVPLQFWFCRNPGLALPLIALQYHEVNISTGEIFTNLVTITQHKLYVDYIYLDTDERRRFAQQSHEYLIEQVQHQNCSSTSHELTSITQLKNLWTGVQATG